MVAWDERHKKRGALTCGCMHNKKARIFLIAFVYFAVVYTIVLGGKKVPFKKLKLKSSVMEY